MTINTKITLIVYFFLSLFSFPYITHAAITEDNSAHDTGTTFSFTTSGTNIGMAFLVLSGGVDNITVSYAGNNATKEGTIVDGGGNRLTLFSLLNADTGTNNVIVSGSDINDTIVSSWNDVDAIVNYNSGQNNDTSIDVEFSVNTEDSWVFSGGTSRTGPHNPIPDTGIVNDLTNGSTQLGAGDSGPETISTITHTWQNGVTSNQNSILGFVLEPVGGGGGPPEETTEYNIQSSTTMSEDTLLLYLTAPILALFVYLGFKSISMFRW